MFMTTNFGPYIVRLFGIVLRVVYLKGGDQHTGMIE